MSINPTQGNIPPGGRPVVDFQALRASRQLQLDARVQDATLSPAQRLSPQEIAQHTAFYNGTVNDVSALKTGDMNSLNNLRQRDPEGCGLGDLFGDWQDNSAVRRATQPNIFDNQDAAQLRREYRNTYAEAKRDLTQAAHTARKLGPGEHHLSNGDDVTVTQDPQSGQTTVTTRSKDGSVKTVQFNSNDPDEGTIDKRRADGSDEQLSVNGTNVSRTNTDPWGQSVTKSYSIDDNGNPVRTTTGPGCDDWEQTTANADGSTDTKNFIYYDDNGQPAYEQTHQDPGFQPWRWQPPIWPNPWRPLPIEPYPWEPEPFRLQNAQAQ